MLGYPISRIQTNFADYNESFTSSATEFGDTSSASNSVNAYTSVVGGISVSVSQVTNHYTASYITNSITYNAENRGVFGGTTSANATMSSYENSQSSSASMSQQASV